MNNKRNGSLTDRLSFCFGALFAFLMIAIPLTAGFCVYGKSISDYTEHSKDDLEHISSLLTDNVFTGACGEDSAGLAERIRSEFGLLFISSIVTAENNSKIMFVSEAVSTSEDADIYAVPYAPYYKDVSPEITKVLSEAWENGTAVSLHDIYGGKYGKALVCYKSFRDENGGAGIMCVGSDIAPAERDAFFDAFMLGLILEAITAAAGVFGMRFIGRHCIMRLKRLSDSIEEYTRIKDPVIAEQIRQSEKGGDEIAVLSQQTASMISELQKHIDRIMKISGELLTANERAEKFSELARKDALTGLENKMAYYEAVNRLDNLIKNGKAEFAFVVIDLNYLKRINDECGHNHGDAMIKKLAELIKEFFRNCGSYRIGGDEFAVIIEGPESEKALTLVSKFREMLDEGAVAGYKRFPSAAVGCANYRAGTDTDTKDVFDRADNEMYGSKIQMKAVRKD